LAGVLKKLSEDNAQIIICTHSPIFVDGRSFNDVRLAQKSITTGEAEILEASLERVGRLYSEYKGDRLPKELAGVEAKIHASLQSKRSEMFFSQRLILVEGIEDEAYLTSYLHLLGYWDDFRKYGASIVPVDAKSQLLMPLIIAKELRIPTYLIFDADLNEKKADKLKKHKEDNYALLSACGIEKPEKETFTDGFFISKGVTVWETQITDLMEKEIGSEWSIEKTRIEVDYGHTKNLTKSALFIGDLVIALDKKGKKSGSMISLCRNIYEFLQTGQGISHNK